VTRDFEGRTPLTFALSNAGRRASPVAVRLLLNLNNDLVNAKDDGPSPFRSLAEYAQARTFGPEERESVLKCLELLLSFDPDPTPDFFTALQSLPEWLRERAVVMKNVQTLLNTKIAQRFPTGILLSDILVQILVLIYYAWSTQQAIRQRCDAGDPRHRQAVEYSWLIPLYIGGAYFFVRALTQILSLLALGAFRVWFENLSNWLDVIYVIVVLFWAIVMTIDPSPRGPGDTVDGGGCDDNDRRFRTAAALSVIILWLKFLGYLQNTYIDFAVFLGGLLHVVRRLVAFLLCLCITLAAFAQMFHTIYAHDPNFCPARPLDNEDFQCGDFSEAKPYCRRWTSFLNTFTMLLGKPLLLFFLFVNFPDCVFLVVLTLFSMY